MSSGHREGEGSANRQDDLAALAQEPAKGPENSPFDGARVGDSIDEFKLLRRIASGGQGEVWEAEQRKLSRKVALKLVLPGRINEKSLALFAREARAGGRLSHPGIVSVHGYGEDDGRHWIAQELVPGAATLRGFIDASRRLDDVPANYYNGVALFVAELADALQAAHDAGVIHRDVKPQNVLVTPDQHPKLTDFGLARIVDESALSVSGDRAGTWLYMSPEQVTAKVGELDQRTDIFSLGVVMYEMLALVRPFDGDTSHQVAKNIITREAPDLRKVRSKVPRDLAVICGKALEKARSARFQSMAEFAADLRRHLVHEPIKAVPPTRANRAAKWVRRNPRKSVVGSVAFGCLMVVLGLTARIANQSIELEAQHAMLIQSRRDLLTTNAELELKRAETQAASEVADREARAAEVEALRSNQLAEDATRLSLAQSYEDLLAETEALWPALPEQIPAMEAWFVRAGELVAELPNLRRRLKELEALAIPRTAEEILLERESHPEYSQLASRRSKIEAIRHSLEVRLGEVEPHIPEVDWSDYPTDHRVLGRLASSLIVPTRTTYGLEGLGMQLARRASVLAPEMEKFDHIYHLVMGHFALGDYEEAIRACKTGLENSKPPQTASYAHFLPQIEGAAAVKTSPEGLARTRAWLDNAEKELVELDARLNDRRDWRFPDQLNSTLRIRWWYHTVERLIQKIEGLSVGEQAMLSATGVDPNLGWSVRRRVDFAARLAAGFAPQGEYLVRWNQAASGIAKAYPALELPVQIGLVPMGQDPDSGLWEFWHVQSGAEPERAEDGTLQLTIDSGIVLVLLPAGVLHMGASRGTGTAGNTDPAANVDEAPVHEVSVPAFFMSKYEMSQGQWKRLTGSNPSEHGPDGLNHPVWNADWLLGTLLYPVEQVSWDLSVLQLRRADLELPSEARWEYACRAGSSTVFWSGDRTIDLADAANLADGYLKGQKGPGFAKWESELNDRNAVESAVDRYRPNGFGLHGVHGNVAEWCADTYEAGYYGRSPSQDPLNRSSESEMRVLRGGHYSSLASGVRSAARASRTRASTSQNLGLRPSRSIVPAAGE